MTRVLWHTRVSHEISHEISHYIFVVPPNLYKVFGDVYEIFVGGSMEILNFMILLHTIVLLSNVSTMLHQNVPSSYLWCAF